MLFRKCAFSSNLNANTCEKPQDPKILLDLGHSVGKDPSSKSSQRHRSFNDEEDDLADVSSSSSSSMRGDAVNAGVENSNFPKIGPSRLQSDLSSVHPVKTPVSDRFCTQLRWPQSQSDVHNDSVLPALHLQDTRNDRSDNLNTKLSDTGESETGITGRGQGQDSHPIDVPSMGDSLSVLVQLQQGSLESEDDLLPCSSDVHRSRVNSGDGNVADNGVNNSVNTKVRK